MHAPAISSVQTLVWLPTQPDPLPAWRKAGLGEQQGLGRAAGLWKQQGCPIPVGPGEVPQHCLQSAAWTNSPGCSRATSDTSTAHQVPADPVQKHQSKGFLYLRDHFTADMDCFQVIGDIIIDKRPNLPFVNNEEAAKNCWMHAHASAFGLTKAFKLHGSSTDTSKAGKQLLKIIWQEVTLHLHPQYLICLNNIVTDKQVHSIYNYQYLCFNTAHIPVHQHYFIYKAFMYINIFLKSVHCQ